MELIRPEWRAPLLFLLLCIPARYALFLYASRVPEKYTAAFGALLAGIGLSFLTLFFTKSRLDAPEAMGGGTWWHSLRPLHGLLYLSAGAILLTGNPKSYAAYCLGADVLLGLGTHISKYWV